MDVNNIMILYQHPNKIGRQNKLYDKKFDLLLSSIGA